MQKKIILLVFIFLQILFFDKVYAEKLNCTYNNVEGLDTYGIILIQYDTESRKYELGLPLVGEYAKAEGTEYKYNGTRFDVGVYSTGTMTTGIDNYHMYLNSGESTIEIDSETCLKIYRCNSGYRGATGLSGTGKSDLYIFYDDIQKAENEESMVEDADHCIWIEANEVKSGVKETKNICKSYEDTKKLIEIPLKEYYENKDIKNLQESNQKIDALKSLCSSIMGHSNHDSSCIKSCLGLSDWIDETKKKYGIGVYAKSGNCGFSERLAIWIANIIRWIKYIIPVIVIVFGILDFIKAIGADKEDEMKKAQKKFIRRLIASALIFIIPFIIEFILNKMGFIANGCGIIDL